MGISANEVTVADRLEHARSGVARGACLDRTRVELDRLHAEHDLWVRGRRKAPEAERYKSALDALDTLVRKGVAQLRAGIEAIDLRQPDGAVYEDCRTFDLRVIWLRRVWEFFRAKFDQRDGHEALHRRGCQGAGDRACAEQAQENTDGGRGRDAALETDAATLPGYHPVARLRDMALSPELTRTRITQAAERRASISRAAELLIGLPNSGA